MASSATLREAIAFGVNHLSLAGPTMQARYRVESGVAVLSGHSLQMSGPLLVFAVDFWRSSINTLLTRIMESPVPSRLMVFPYLAPPHWREYTQILKCPVEFVEGVMEWHLIESALDQPCPNANPITAQISQALCERMINAPAEGNSLVRRIRIECVNSPGQVISAEEMADRLHMSARSMFRHLSAEETSYQDIVDDVRSKLANEYLRETLMSTEEVGCRLGFSDASSFRKAFKRWNGMTPSEYRQSITPSLA
jgi:AraC-like DNA-binding protein